MIGLSAMLDPRKPTLRDARHAAETGTKLLVTRDSVTWEPAKVIYVQANGIGEVVFDDGRAVIVKWRA